MTSKLSAILLHARRRKAMSNAARLALTLAALYVAGFFLLLHYVCN